MDTIKYVVIDIRGMEIYLCQTMRHVAKQLNISHKTFKRILEKANNQKVAYKNFVIIQNVDILKAQSRGVSI